MESWIFAGSTFGFNLLASVNFKNLYAVWPQYACPFLCPIIRSLDMMGLDQCSNKRDSQKLVDLGFYVLVRR